MGLYGFLKKKASPKRLIGFVLVPLGAILSTVFLWSDGPKALGFVILIASALAGSVGGELLGHRLQKRFPKIGEGAGAACSGFGFLFLPPLLAEWTNANLNTEIEMEPLALHFLWACIVAGVLFFAIGSTTKK